MELRILTQYLKPQDKYVSCLLAFLKLVFILGYLLSLKHCDNALTFV